MMNRSVMQRQMFAKGGAAGFPDLTRPGGGPPDGKVTQADILQGRGVKLMEQGGSPAMATFVNPQSGERVTLNMADQDDVNMMERLVEAGYVMDSSLPNMQELGKAAVSKMPQFTDAQTEMDKAYFEELNRRAKEAGMTPVGMQMGGEPMAAMASEQLMQSQPMPPMAEEPAMPMGVGEVDQQTVENVLTEVAKDVDDPEQAGSFEEMMNNVRGDDMPMNERRAELAAIVGPEDAARTPDSVLALLQPVLQLNSVDQGIGGLAEQEMQQPVEGDMAGGIMSMMGG
jgi:hypothetical protein